MFSLFHAVLVIKLNTTWPKLQSILATPDNCSEVLCCCHRCYCFFVLFKHVYQHVLILLLYDDCLLSGSYIWEVKTINQKDTFKTDEGELKWKKGPKDISGFYIYCSLCFILTTVIASIDAHIKYGNLHFTIYISRRRQSFIYMYIRVEWIILNYFDNWITHF